MSEFAQKLRSLSFPRKTGLPERRPVIDERDGSIGGYQTEHWDGRQDAEVHLKPVDIRTRVVRPAEPGEG